MHFSSDFSSLNALGNQFCKSTFWMILETHLLDKKFQEFWKCPEMISIYFCVVKLFISVQYQLLKDTFTIPTKISLRKKNMGCYCSPLGTCWPCRSSTIRNKNSSPNENENNGKNSQRSHSTKSTSSEIINCHRCYLFVCTKHNCK